MLLAVLRGPQYGPKPMAGLSQSQHLSQNQVLAPQLQQSLQILQVPMLELRNLIQQEIESNPTIELEQTEPTIEDNQRLQEVIQTWPL